MKPQTAGLIYGPMPHHLDHIAPYCALAEIPLIATEEAIAEEAKRYYPDLEVLYWDYLEASQKLSYSFDLIVTTLPRPIFDDAFIVAQIERGKKIPTLFLPHGNSDKGHLSPLMEGFLHESDVLVYGQKMIDFLKAKGAYAHLASCREIGNYRLRYFSKHAAFYRSLSAPYACPGKKTILYAPTWNDAEGSSSLEEAWRSLRQGPPEGYRLLVKLHPNTSFTPAEDHPDISFIEPFPPVYPLLEIANVYLGDMSSVGYDFLAMDRPMFFLNQNRRDSASDPGLHLHRCGIGILPEDYPRIYEIIEHSKDQKELSPLRKNLYDYTFGINKM